MPFKDHAAKLECQKRYRIRHRDELRIKNKEYFERNKTSILQKSRIWSKDWGRRNPEKKKAIYKEWIKKHPEKKREYDRLYYARHYTREKLFHTLNQFWCQHCGQHDKRCLQFDHINGGGCAENLMLGSPFEVRKFYILHPEEARKKLQVLCANCNVIKKIEKREFRTRGGGCKEFE